MYELVKRMRELQAITEHCDEQSCGECENRELCDKYDNKTLSGTYKEAADAIEELLAERDEVNADSWKTAFEVERDEHRWIPVTERLPEKDVRVIVCASLPEGVHSDFIYEDGHWFVSTGVTHWMSLPEPPEEESNGV